MSVLILFDMLTQYTQHYHLHAYTQQYHLQINDEEFLGKFCDRFFTGPIFQGCATVYKVDTYSSELIDYNIY